MSRNLYDLIGLAAGICFIYALKGLSSPKSARRGNLIGAVGATIATVIVFFYANDGKALNNQTLILAAIGFGVLKLALHRACIAKLFEDNQQVLDAENIFALAKEMV